jgi:hypothetical protein
VNLAVLLFAAAAATQAPAPPLADPETTIARIDVNKDGGASLQEWLAVGNHAGGFALMDTDKDGKVTVAELIAFRAARAKGEIPPAPAAPR